MRFKILFDKDLVSEKYLKSWFSIDQDPTTTEEVISQISALFHIDTNFYLELEDFIIPDNQYFTHIVREDELVCAKKGVFKIGKSLNPFLYKQTNIRSKNSENTSKNLLKINSNPPKVKKIIKKSSSDSSSTENIKKEKTNSSDSSSLSENYSKKNYFSNNKNTISVKKNSHNYISESSDSEKIEKVQKKEKFEGKSLPKAIVPIKSILKHQPEPEFVPVSEYKYNIEEFTSCSFENLQVDDEILYKTLEIKEDSTPGVSDYKVIDI